MKVAALRAAGRTLATWMGGVTLLAMAPLAQAIPPSFSSQVNVPIPAIGQDVIVNLRAAGAVSGSPGHRDQHRPRRRVRHQRHRHAGRAWLSRSSIRGGRGVRADHQSQQLSATRCPWRHTCSCRSRRPTGCRKAAAPCPPGITLDQCRWAGHRDRGQPGAGRGLRGSTT